MNPKSYTLRYIPLPGELNTILNTVIKSDNDVSPFAFLAEDKQTLQISDTQELIPIEIAKK